MNLTILILAPLVVGALMMTLGYIVDAVRSLSRPRPAAARPHVAGRSDHLVASAFGPNWSRN